MISISRTPNMRVVLEMQMGRQIKPQLVRQLLIQIERPIDDCKLA
jgi:hypothetical protein